MSKDFKSGKFYGFYMNLFKSLGGVVSLRRVKDSYDIIIDLCKGYYLKLTKCETKNNTVVIELNFYYSYGYKNINMATIEGVITICTDSFDEVKECIRYFRNLTKSYVKNKQNNRDYMLKVQEKDVRRYY